MRNSKKLLSLALALILCLSLSACGSTPSLQDDDNDGLGGDLTEDTVNDFSDFEGTWLGEENNEYDYITLDADGNWFLYLDGNIVFDGYLQYEPEWESIYAYNYQDGSGGRFMLEDDGRLYISTYGYFISDEDMKSINNNDDYWSWDSDLCQRNVSEFEGIWYYNGDLDAETYIVIDDFGNWSYYQRAPGAEPAEMDYGTFSYSLDELSTYYADSDLYDNVSYKVFELDDGVLIWDDEGSYYLME